MLKNLFQVANQPLEIPLRYVQRRAFALQRQIVAVTKDYLDKAVFGGFLAADLDGVGHAIDFDDFEFPTQIRHFFDDGGRLLPKVALAGDSTWMRRTSMPN